MENLNAEQVKSDLEKFTKNFECCHQGYVEACGLICKVCGLEAYVTDEIPGEFAFGLVEVPMTQREKVYREGYEAGVRELAERLKQYYASLPIKTMPSVVEYHIDRKMKELLEKEE